MKTLEKSLRNKLERTVIEARDVAEAAASAAVEQLGVGEAKPFVHLSNEDKELRRKLRIHGRQLGDDRHAKDETQETNRLVEEIAYEHWHRMLFARFLAENNLLMQPDPDDPVAVSLEECEDLAVEEGAKNGWELAARYASRMLPQIFRTDSPVFKLILPPEHQRDLERLVSGLSEEVFNASDSLGWVYQFWQTKKKNEVNASEVKIGAKELPAVTQLFTEPYMVSFLLDNSLGAWWAGRRLTEDDLKNAQSEEELRAKASLPGVPLEYLRFVKQEDGTWTPAAGTFDGWPKKLEELKTLDPCCGSGHFLVAALLMLVPMRMESEGLSAREAVDRVLAENIHGLELDKRCVELAAFALALTAWLYPEAGGYRALPEMNVACVGLSVSVSKEEWQKLANGDRNLRIALGLLYDEFRNAPVLGSLINPSKSTAAKIVEWGDLIESLRTALSKERTDAEYEAGVIAQGLAKAANLLTEKYGLVVTNVPYLARGKQDEILKEFCEKQHADAKNDLATAFLDRCLELCVEGGTTNVVLPQNWLFLTSYKKFRVRLLKNDCWNLIARLGPKGFSTPMWDFNVQLLTISRRNAVLDDGGLFGEAVSSNLLRGVDVSEPRTAGEKAAQLLVAEIKSVEQEKQLEHPDARIVLEEGLDLELLGEAARTGTGIQTFDSPRFLSCFWELGEVKHHIYKYCQSTVRMSRFYGGESQVLRWQNGEGELAKMMADKEAFEGYKSGIWKAWQRHQDSKGVCVSLMGRLPVSLYLGSAFDNNTGVVVPNDEEMLPAIWSFCESSDFNESVRQIDQKLNVTNATLVKVPFDLDHWTKVAEEKYPNGLPKPYSDNPTQWLFHGYPAHSDEPLQVAVVRLLGYRWPAELDTEMELSDEACELVKKSKQLLPLADDDGIVCIPAVRGEATGAERLLNLLAEAYGNDWSSDKLSELLKQADHAGKTLDSWLREKFFTQHCKLFHHRPFIWHIWDGLNDGFAALVNYHKLDRKNLETLIYTYLGDWIKRQKDDKASGIDGADEKLAAAEVLKKRLELILEGEEPYDIFVRWKPLEKQPIGWEPDLNDGVRLNIRPFLSVPDVKKRGAGVFKDKPNVKWTKDRGKDVESAPWYQLGLEYGGKEGDRINDHHLSLEEKISAREKP